MSVVDVLIGKIGMARADPSAEELEVSMICQHRAVSHTAAATEAQKTFVEQKIFA